MRDMIPEEILSVTLSVSLEIMIRIVCPPPHDQEAVDQPIMLTQSRILLEPRKGVVYS